jgi:hypothetical protein
LYQNADAAKAAQQALVNIDKAIYPNATVSLDPGFAPDAIAINATQGNLNFRREIWMVRGGIKDVEVIYVRGKVQESDIIEYAEAVKQNESAESGAASPTRTATLPSSDFVAVYVPAGVAVPPTLDGNYVLVMVIKLDNAGHAQYVGMPSTIQVFVKIGSITITGPAPWVNVTGPLNPDGTFTATGTGVVAGRQDIGVQFVGKISSSGLSGDYSMGVKSVGGTLPTGQPIIFSVQGQRIGASSPSPTTVAAITTFAKELSQALRVNDKTGLVQNLHPTVFQVYTAAQCQTHFNQRAPDPSYNIQVLGAQGPAIWNYTPEQRAIPVADVYTVDANLTEKGQVTRTAVHFGVVNNRLYWFDRCT